jgi:hypothetical protein
MVICFRVAVLSPLSGTDEIVIKPKDLTVWKLGKCKKKAEKRNPRLRKIKHKV